MKGIRMFGVALVCVLGCLASAAAAGAATYNVNDTRDLAQSSTASPGTCVSTAQTCTLRAAVQAANQSGGSNTVNLPAGTYPIDSSTSDSSSATPSTDNSVGEFKVNPGNNSTQITVAGAGSGVTVINAQGKDRIFDVFQNGVLDLQKMTLENGSPDISSQDHSLGGAIYSQGHLSAETVTFTGNSTSGKGAGGAVAADDYPGSTVSITGSVLQNNTAFNGGALWTDAPNDVTIAFTLLQSNSSTGSSGGGAIDGAIHASALTLNFDDVAQNVADPFGGGVAWYGTGALTVTNSLFSQNQTTGGQGGALFNGSTSTNITISNTSFDGNSTYHSGGAISDGVCSADCGSVSTYVVGSASLTLVQDKFADNTATSDFGGGLEVVGSSTTLSGDEFDGNTATAPTGYYGGGYGGAIDWENGGLAILGSSFVANASKWGGALDAVNDQLLKIVDSTMSRNTATASGGAIYTDYGTAAAIPVTLTNDTIAFNNAPSGAGGGIYDPSEFKSGGSATGGFGLQNTTIAENSGGDCGGAKFAPAVDLGNNDDSDQSCLAGAGGPNDLVGVNPLLSDPANNGGPAAGGPGDTETLQTDAEQSGSPTVDTGNNNGCPSVDERGVTRPQGKACDIGAFEFGASPLSTTTTATSSVTTTVPGTTTTTTSTTTSPHRHKPKHKRCARGKVRRHGRCVKKHKKHHEHHQGGHHKKRRK